MSDEAPVGTGAHPLAGRTALVTGASRGIGRATAVALAAAGATVVCVARSAAALDEAAAAAGPRAIAVVGDIADAGDVARLAATVRERLGHAPDILVNNAGLFRIAPVHELDTDDFAAMVQVNLVAPFRLVREFLGELRARGAGHVVTIGSIADRQVFPDNVGYAASKHGARAMHEVLRAELQGTGVRATLVSPGPVDTPLWDPVDPDNREGFPPRAAMLRAEDVADAVAWAVTRPGHVNVDELRLGRA